MALSAIWDAPAPAKLNLFLHVIGRRADGYHLLQSPFVMIDWFDTLHFERRPDALIRRHDLGEPLPADDLCVRAATLLQAESGHTEGVDISIDKRLPSGAGMGGGSSDAATVLLALNRLWGLQWPRERLMALGERLGADVPFFVGGRNAIVEGIGEKLTPFDLPPQRFAVVKPPASIPTQAIFSSPQLVRDTEPVIVAGLLQDAHAFREGVRQGRNDLQPAAEHHAPDVTAAARWLAQRFGNSRMSGSGSAVFSIADFELNTSAADPSGPTPLADLPPGWMGRMCRSLVHHPLVGWAG